LHASNLAHRKAIWLLAAIVGAALLLASPALSQAEESNPNNYNCLGSTSGGQPEEGSEEQQVAYTFYCNGPITGYQVQSQIPVTGVSSPPEVTNIEKTVLRDTFSCSGEVPGWAANCVGSTKAGYETISGQIAINLSNNVSFLRHAALLWLCLWTHRCPSPSLSQITMRNSP